MTAHNAAEVSGGRSGLFPRGQRTPALSGLLLLDKQPCFTSFESLKLIKRAFSSRKAGHTGTLDKFASGLLLVLVGRAVKLSPWFLNCDKRYEGTVYFGAETDTLDPEGAVIAEAAPPSRESLEQALPGFRGNLLQAPPAYSAVHVGGERAHRLARSGRVPEMERRPISVYALDLLSYDPPLARIRVHCSKGTYIRSLTRDIALAAGSRGHLRELRRTWIAGFSVEDALNPGTGPETLDETRKAAVRAALRPLDAGIFQALGIPCLRVDAKTARDMGRGGALAGLLKPEETESIGGSAAVFDPEGRLAAVVERRENGFRYGFVNLPETGSSGGNDAAY
ncbi:MAG: tRNA pseudouridine(55) synthase TruB [Treponema sp.]|jgi:tRNA pseudouridine55 synthase|nr:tRNA pseudouridine(55) synthase TruB [Treponema sp.]